MKRATSAVAILAMTLGSMTTSAIGRHQPTCYEFHARDTEMAQRINSVRRDNFLRMLDLDPELARVARKHTYEMIAAGRLRHTPDDVLQQRVTRWNSLGESVLRTDNLDELMRKLRNYDGHRANLLEPTFVYVGVSAIRSEGTLWATVLYEATRDPGTTLQMPTC